MLSRIKEYFFGTFDRSLTSASFLASVLSLAATVYLWKFPESVPQLIIIRDIVVIASFATIAMVILSKYIRRETTLNEALKQVETSKEILFKQYSNFFDLVDKYKNSLFEYYLGCISIPSNLTYNKNEKRLFERICHSLTTEIQNLFQKHFEARGIDIKKEDIAVSVKLALSSKNICDTYGKRLNKTQIESLRSNDKQWVLTVYRDPDTFENNKNREIATTLYDIDQNTAFSHIFRSQKKDFACDDLNAIGSAYRNENDRWKDHYNSTLVVPIRYYNKQIGDFFYFGLIAVDSKNENKIKPLYDNEECRCIMHHAAGVLAGFFLMIAVCSHNNKEPA